MKAPQGRSPWTPEIPFVSALAVNLTRLFLFLLEARFLCFENVVSAEERKDIERDVAEIIERAPIFPNSKLDEHGRPAFGHDCEGRGYRLTRPLEDALGGTGRCP